VELRNDFVAKDHKNHIAHHAMTYFKTKQGYVLCNSWAHGGEKCSPLTVISGEGRFGGYVVERVKSVTLILDESEHEFKPLQPRVNEYANLIPRFAGQYIDMLPSESALILAPLQYVKPNGDGTGTTLKMSAREMQAASVVGATSVWPLPKDAILRSYTQISETEKNLVLDLDNKQSKAN
jgi:hypothetical protein